MLEVYKWVKENVDSNPLVLDAEDFVRDQKTTEQVFSHLCQHIGMSFDRSMLQWDQADYNKTFTWQNSDHLSNDAYMQTLN